MSVSGPLLAELIFTRLNCLTWCDEWIILVFSSSFPLPIFLYGFYLFFFLPIFELCFYSTVDDMDFAHSSDESTCCTKHFRIQEWGEGGDSGVLTSVI
ncbi:hypothetical protein M441DRAFT_53521 [Trichoderma asperellum CBS 433.97]|uniref:Uncharacterized protein n=1 Tax=Trichoderma asperellum (strain ATCC 204424 / CBS 433.97 / NBRC 101777) TaxID=1042311 RepID=A0A2T3ZPW1_TRIA4|nr:hypothetical protein M441DRAFT_53521 [Trichoderma asperellum CBS 433.97]PTB46819.1 hypothetical protein M441DRAFT_53521 [Trichoderma asperellum CBS 433.97]